MEDKKEQVADVFSREYNCSQAVLSVFAEELGMSRVDVLKIASGFGGGVRKGNICGAVSGAIMALGLKYSHSIEGDSLTKSEMYKKTEDFQEQFIGLNNSIICRDLLGYDVTSEGDRNIIMEKNLFENVCPQMVKDAVGILEEFLK